MTDYSSNKCPPFVSFPSCVRWRVFPPDASFPLHLPLNPPPHHHHKHMLAPHVHLSVFSLKVAWFLRPLSASLWSLPSFLWACSDLLAIPLIYGSYIICCNIVHRATGCSLMSVSVVITQLQGWTQDWERGMDGWYNGTRWLDNTFFPLIDEQTGCG